jgi:hypothetical protein
MNKFMRHLTKAPHHQSKHPQIHHASLAAERRAVLAASSPKSCEQDTNPDNAMPSNQHQ